MEVCAPARSSSWPEIRVIADCPRLTPRSSRGGSTRVQRRGRCRSTSLASRTPPPSCKPTTPSIWQALQYCGAHRIGHGVRLVEDMAVADGRVVKLGPLATYVRDKRIPLELCPSSNVDTGAVPTLAEHPIRHFIAQRFRVTVNTDNRLMSNVTLSDEFQRLSRIAALTLSDIERLSINAMKSAFVGYDERVAIIYARIKPGYARLRGEPALAGYPLPPSA